MAFISVAESARARLAATKGVHITADPLPHHPEVAALVMASIRCMHVTTDGDSFSASVHLRAGEWLPLAEDVTEDAAFAAVLAFVSLVAAVPQHYAPEHDAAERAAAAEVYAAFAAPISLAA